MQRRSIDSHFLGGKAHLTIHQQGFHIRMTNPHIRGRSNEPPETPNIILCEKSLLTQLLPAAAREDAAPVHMNSSPSSRSPPAPHPHDRFPFRAPFGFISSTPSGSLPPAHDPKHIFQHLLVSFRTVFQHVSSTHRCRPGIIRTL